MRIKLTNRLSDGDVCIGGFGQPRIDAAQFVGSTARHSLWRHLVAVVARPEDRTSDSDVCAAEGNLKRIRLYKAHHKKYSGAENNMFIELSAIMSYHMTCVLPLNGACRLESACYHAVKKIVRYHFMNFF